MTQPHARFVRPLIATVVSLVLGIAALIPGMSAQAVGTLDQQFAGAANTYTVIENGTPKGQTFTAGITGQLDRFTIQLQKQGSPGVLNGSIYAESNGVITGSALATTTVAEASVSSSSMVSVNFDFSTPATVTAGTTYVFVVEAPGGSTSYLSVPPFTPTYNNYIMYFGAPGAEPAGTHSLYMGSGSPWLIFNQSFLFASYVTPTVISSSTPSSTPSSSSPSLANTGTHGDSVFQIASGGLLLAVVGGVIFNLSRGRQRRSE